MSPIDQEKSRYKKLDPESRHYCVDWDGLAIDAFCPEWGYNQGECNCGFKRKIAEEKPE